MNKSKIKKYSEWKTLRSRWKIPRYARIHKPAILRMPEDGYLQNSHFPIYSGACELLLPLEHFKFSDQVIQRAQSAIERGSHFNGSAEYCDFMIL